MDMLLEAKEGGKSSKHHRCCKLLVTDKCFVYVVPVQVRKELMFSVKQFAEEVAAQEATICHASREQQSKDLILDI